jgi:hypothetical protein
MRVPCASRGPGDARRASDARTVVPRGADGRTEAGLWAAMDGLLNVDKTLTIYLDDN